MFEIHDPHFLLKHEYLPDSAGAGRWRGGLGVETEFLIRGEHVTGVAFGDGVEEEARALASSAAGRDRAMTSLSPSRMEPRAVQDKGDPAAASRRARACANSPAAGAVTAIRASVRQPACWRMCATAWSVSQLRAMNMACASTRDAGAGRAGHGATEEEPRLSAPHIDHIGIIVTDIAQASLKLRPLFGECAAIRDLPEVGLRVAEFHAANVVIELLQYTGEAAFARRTMGERPGLNHISRAWRTWTARSPS